MKILCVFTGSLRLDLNIHVHYINEFKKNFNKLNYELTYIFISDKNNPYNYCDYDYYKRELLKHVNDVLYISSNDILMNTKTINNYTTISLMYYKYIQEYIINNNLNFDYIIKIRNDLLIKISDINNYLNNNTYVPPRYWYNIDVNSLANENFFIIPLIKYMLIDFSDNNILRMSLISYDIEILTQNLILPDKVIDMNDIEEYLLNGSTKFHIKNNKYITSSFPIHYSILN